VPQVQLHYDGWLTLPAAVRQKLGLSTGDRLEIELADGAVLLRPAATGRAARLEATAAALQPAATASGPEPADVAAPVVKRGPGRPRKLPIAALPPAPKARGRRQAALSADTQPR
jgi:AbrB family looped-hinge helix DNA binding protein